MPGDPRKSLWDFVIGILLILTCLTIPIQLAMNYDKEETSAWIFFNRAIDFMFAIDIVLTFNTAIQIDQCLYITDRNQIAKKYLKKWFWIDLIVTLPFADLLSLWSMQMKNLAQLAKFVRILKLIRLIRLVKLLKVVKEKHQMALMMSSKVKFNHGLKRLILAVLCFILLCHVVACLWILHAR